MIILYGQKSLSSILISTDACIRSSILCNSTSISLLYLVAAMAANNKNNNNLENHLLDIEYTQISLFKQNLIPVDYWDQLMTFKYNIDQQSKLTTVEY